MRPTSADRGRGAGLAAVLLLGALLSTTPAPACELAPGPLRAVAAVIDAATLRLDDGSTVRLVGAHPPGAGDAIADESFWPPERAARAALEQLVAGQSVELAFDAVRSDRYGRQLAHVYAITGAGRVWVQGYLVENGHARAYALPGNATCLAELLALEERARSAGLGLWTHAAYQVRRAERTRELLRYRNTLQLVEGTVKNASLVKRQLFLNFGEDWRVDFTAGLKPEPVRGAGLDAAAVKALEGRSIRVRGWVEWRGGPYVELFDGREIELLAEH